MYAIVDHNSVYHIYKNRKVAQRKADKMNWEHGAHRYSVKHLAKF